MFGREIKMRERILWLAERVQDHKVVIGVSGGLDSVVSLKLLSQVKLDSEIIPVLLPAFGQEMAVAKEVVEKLNLSEQMLSFDLTEAMQVQQKLLGVGEEDLVRRGNLLARMRMAVLYDVAKKNQGVVCGTMNLSEYLLGYYTLWGDGVADIEPIRDLTKTGVRELAVQLRVDQSIIDQAPTADLWPGQTDEQEMGFSYAVADEMFAKMLAGRTDYNEEEQRVFAWLDAHEYKKKLPLVFASLDEMTEKAIADAQVKDN